MNKALWVGFCLYLISNAAFSVTPQQQAAKTDADNFGNTQSSNLSNIPSSTPSSDVPGYVTNNPSQTTYYNNPTQITTDAANAAATDPNQTFVQDSFATRPEFIVDRQNDPVMTRSDSITTDPTTTVGMISDTYSGCNGVTSTGSCVPTFTNQTCDETIKTDTNTCQKTRQITVSVAQSCNPGDILYSGTIKWPLYDLSGNVNPYVWHQGTFTIQCGPTDTVSITTVMTFYASSTTNFLTQTAAKASTFLLSNGDIVWRITSNLNTYTAYTYYGYYNYYYGLKIHPVCTGITCTLSIQPAYVYDYLLPEPQALIDSYNTLMSYGYWCPDMYNKPSNWVVGSSWVKPFPNDYVFFYFSCLPDITPQNISITHPQQVSTITGEVITDSCTTYESLTPTQCNLDSEVCTDGPSTHTINGLDIYRDCWNWEDQYTCSAGPSNNNCAPLRTAGCEQIDSSCLYAFSNGECSVFTQTMRCPDNNCSASTQMLCGDQAYCIDGSCIDQTEDPDTNFAEAATRIEAVQQAAKDMDPATLEIFKGHDMRCTVDTLSYSDCCKVTGWGQSIGIARCTTQEDQLAQYRGAAMCHYVGTYCSKTLNCLLCSTCIQDTQTYCCFSSKLARIIQEQGRPQLSISWGTSTAPNCAGFTPDQLASLDFSKMDLSEFYSDLNTTPNSSNSQTTTRVQNHITTLLQ